jgi:hypothetical protein
LSDFPSGCTGIPHQIQNATQTIEAEIHKFLQSQSALRDANAAFRKSVPIKTNR